MQHWNESHEYFTTVPPLAPVLSLPARLRLEENLFTGRGVCIALIDSGFVPHPDLTQPVNRILRYYDAVEHEEHPLPPAETYIRSWHGTMTACTAAGNGFLSRGLYESLAPGAEIVLIRTMQDSGRIPTSVIVEALSWCIANCKKYSINIVNLSVYSDEDDFSTDHPVTRLVEELTALGVVVVAASGNNPAYPLRPPAVAPSAITVGGLDDKNTLHLPEYTLYNSSFGKTPSGALKPEVVAPAIWLPAPILPGTPVATEAAALCALDAMTNEMIEQILPLLIGYTSLPPELVQSHKPLEIRAAIAERILAEKIISSHYKHVDGTSFAAPIVCSIIARMFEANPKLTPLHIRNILISTAVFMKGFPRERQGYGRVDAVAAIKMAQRIV